MSRTNHTPSRGRRVSRTFQTPLWGASGMSVGQGQRQEPTLDPRWPHGRWLRLDPEPETDALSGQTGSLD